MLLAPLYFSRWR